MKNTLFSVLMICVVLVQFSCKGVKNVSGTLTKSEPGSSRRGSTQDGYTDYSRMPAGTSGRDTTYLRTGNQSTRDAVTSDVYRKDYGRTSNGPTGNTVPGNVNNAGYANAELNDRLVKQYAEMDRLADLVLYELNIVEKRWDSLLATYKTAAPADRERISMDLDRLSADQLRLYRAHVKIYKDGKVDWPGTKKDVEATLLAVRGLNEK